MEHIILCKPWDVDHVSRLGLVSVRQNFGGSHPTETLMRLFGSECQIKEPLLLKGKAHFISSFWYCKHFFLLFYKTSYHNEEVNNTEPFPLVSVPWSGWKTNRSNMSRHLFIVIVSDTTWSTATATALAALARSLPRPTTRSAPSESPSTPESVASGCSTEMSPTLSKQGDPLWWCYRVLIRLWATTIIIICYGQTWLRIVVS